MNLLLKYKSTILWIIIIFFIGFFIGKWGRSVSPKPAQTAEVAHDHKKTDLWTCSMHPQIKLEEPGQCPICFMDLIPLEKSGGEDNQYQVSFSESAVKLAEIQTAAVKRKRAFKTIDLAGKLALNEKQTYAIASDVNGRIEKMFIEYSGEKVTFGAPLYTIYSPALYSIQEELLQQVQMYERTNKQIYKHTAQTIKEKLALLGLMQKQIQTLEKNQQAKKKITIYAKHSGTVINKNIKEGDYVKQGTVIYKIANLDTLWLQLDVYEQDIGWLKIGQAVQFSLKTAPGKQFTGEIEFIHPQISVTNQSARVRVAVPNSAKQLKPGTFARAEIKVAVDASGKVAPKTIQSAVDLPLLIPASAPLLTGKRALVFVRKNQSEKAIFEAREVTLGPKVGQYYVVLSGLKAGDQVVYSGNFKIDSAMQLAGKFSMMSIEDEAQNSKNENGNVFIPLYLSYFNLQEALVQDKFDRAKSHYHELYDKIDELSVKHQPFSHAKIIKWKIIKTDLLDHQAVNVATLGTLRQQFKVISANLIDLAKIFGQIGDLKFKEAYCPMAFDNQGAFWLQKNEQIANPYYGAKMLRCGEIKTNFGK